MQIKRDKHLNNLIICMNNGMTKVVIDFRRCGKTHLSDGLWYFNLELASIRADANM